VAQPRESCGPHAVKTPAKSSNLRVQFSTTVAGQTVERQAEAPGKAHHKRLT
jgi:hypothetical protein